MLVKSSSRLVKIKSSGSRKSGQDKTDAQKIWVKQQSHDHKIIQSWLKPEWSAFSSSTTRHLYEGCVRVHVSLCRLLDNVKLCRILICVITIRLGCWDSELRRGGPGYRGSIVARVSWGGFNWNISDKCQNSSGFLNNFLLLFLGYNWKIVAARFLLRRGKRQTWNWNVWFPLPVNFHIHEKRGTRAVVCTHARCPSLGSMISRKDWFSFRI